METNFDSRIAATEPVRPSAAVSVHRSALPSPQLELTFPGAPARSRRSTARAAGQGQASWWFDRMRQVVDLARDPQPV